MNNSTVQPDHRNHGAEVVAMFSDQRHAEEVVHRLAAAGFAQEEIVILGPAEAGNDALDGRLGLPAEVESGDRRRDEVGGAWIGALLGLILGAELVALSGFAGVA